MKNKKLLFGFLTLILAGSVMIFATSATKKNSKYTPRTEQNAKNKAGINGAVEYLAAMRNNPITGDINAKWVADADKEVQLLSNQKGTSALNLTWNELGPDNIGGRTRAILIDRSNTNIMYAGGVSGGLWKSTTAGSSWIKINDMAENLAVVSIAQDKNGAIYVGTGEGLASGMGTANGSTGFIGKGIFKSTDGVTFTLLPSTTPIADNSPSAAWAYVNKLDCDPNTGRIYAATNKGLKTSDDGGTTWIIPIKFPNGNDNTSEATDVDVAPDGTVITSLGNKGYVSTNGDINSFVNQSNSQTGDLPIGSISRIEFAISPSNTNYIYASVAKTDGTLYNVYRSTDKGDTWTIIGPGGSQTFQPLGNQGWYDNTVIVHPTNPDKVYVGGLDLWTWQYQGTWTQKTLWYLDPTSAYYIHADHHIYLFHPTDPNIMYAGSDGGVHRSTDGGNTWQTMNKNYNTIQCYALATSPLGFVMTGTQDNGTLLVPRIGAFPMNGYPVMGGDGGWPAFSAINPEIFFATTYYAGTGRSPDMGTTFYPAPDGSSPFFAPKMIPAGSAAGEDNFPASFVTPMLIWESLKDLYSSDSIEFTPNPIVNEKMGKGSAGVSEFSGILERDGQPNAKLVPGTLKIIAGNLSMNDNGSGSFTGDVLSTGTNTIDYNTGAFHITFLSAPSNGAAVLGSYEIKYESGSTIIIESGNRPGKFTYLTPTDLTKEDTVMIQDIIQAKYYMGFNNAIWMTKEALNFGGTPNWFKVATIPTSTYQTTQCMALSGDGNYLFVGTSNGKLFRISNLRSAQDSLTADVSATSTCLVTTKQLTINSASRAITSIAVDQSDASKIIVTLGNYGDAIYVYRSINALDTIPTFTSKQGNLPKMPVYASLIPMFNSTSVVLGTEFGVFATDNIDATSVVWTDENTGMAHVPVYQLIQQTNNFPNVYNYGTIYIGTHGRGIFECTKYTSIIDNEQTTLNNAYIPLTVSLYPNPVNESATIKFNIANSSDVKIRIYDIQGKLISTFNLSSMAAGSHSYSFDCSSIKKGTYIVNVVSGNDNATTKFVKM